MKLAQKTSKAAQKMSNGTNNKHGVVQLTVIGKQARTKTTDNGVWVTWWWAIEGDWGAVKCKHQASERHS
jgi:hypothetical protein